MTTEDGGREVAGLREEVRWLRVEVSRLRAAMPAQVCHHYPAAQWYPGTVVYPGTVCAAPARVPLTFTVSGAAGATGSQTFGVVLS